MNPARRVDVAANDAADDAADDGAAFAIATHLLDDSGSGWSNLGDWRATADYAQAAAALARSVGEAAQLQPDDRVLELACGQGASLLLWQREFAVRCVDAIEWQRTCVDALNSAGGDARRGNARVHHGRFDRLPLPPALNAASFSAVVCVDAAYHADSAAAFLGVAAQALETGGRLAFTTLAGPPSRHATPWRTAFARLALAAAGVPEASLLTLPQWRAALAQQGLQIEQLRTLDSEVLAGFADFVERRQHRLPWRARFTAGWLKIRLTAALCRWLHRHALAHYVLIVARRSERGADT